MPREPRHASNRQAAIDGNLPSRTQKKQQMHDLQALGEELAALPEDRLAKLKIEDRLRDAIAEMKRVRSFEGRRRQLQYIGKLMKFEDPVPLREAVASFRVGSASDTLALHQAEYWRDELLAGDDALKKWVEEYPATDIQQLRSLVRSARKEKLEPGERHGRAYRDLFRLVKEQMQGVGGADDGTPPTDPSHDD